MTNEMSPDLASYDYVLVAFSGGKDSLACLLHLLDSGVDKSKIELHHHCIDGREGSNLMDWPVTEDYCRKVAAAFGVPIYFSWLNGGFEKEMLRDNTPKAPTSWENPDGTIGTSGGKGKPNTRLKFPQVSADLSVRWCSSYCKVDCLSATIAGQSRFLGKRTLVVTGERAQESSARAKYKVFEPDRSHTQSRHVDHFRPIHKWTAEQVWSTIARYKVNPHPAYRAGFGRVSCQFCIFGNANQCASARRISPERFEKVCGYEEKFGVTIKRGTTFRALAEQGTPYPAAEADVEAARATTFEEPIFTNGDWTMPSGAFAESCGPI